jgi:hypothetical protein
VAVKGLVSPFIAQEVNALPIPGRWLRGAVMDAIVLTQLFAAVKRGEHWAITKYIDQRMWRPERGGWRARPHEVSLGGAISLPEGGSDLPPIQMWLSSNVAYLAQWSSSGGGGRADIPSFQHNMDAPGRPRSAPRGPGGTRQGDRIGRGST